MYWETINGDWYAPVKKLSQYKNVTKALLIDVSSSAGDWSGLFVVKHNKNFYVLPFWQQNNYPNIGFRLFTSDVAQCVMDKEPTDDELANIFETISW